MDWLTDRVLPFPLIWMIDWLIAFSQLDNYSAIMPDYHKLLKDYLIEKIYERVIFLLIDRLVFRTMVDWWKDFVMIVLIDWLIEWILNDNNNIDMIDW